MLDVGGVGHVWNHGTRGPADETGPVRRPAPATGNRISARIAAVVAVGHPGRRRQGQGAAGGRGSTSSASAPASPTSRRPAHIVEAAAAACRDPRNHRYTPTAGLPELREAIAAKTRRDSGLEVAAAQVLVTNGGKQAVANAFAVLCDPGDEVLVPAPVLDDVPRGHRPRRRRARWSSRPTSPPASGSPVDQLEAARTPATKVLLFVSPSNPTGAVYPRAEIEAIGRWAAEHGHLGGHRRDLRAPGLRRRRAPLDAGGRARAGRPLPRGQRRGQDLRHDRLAGGLDDRPDRRRSPRPPTCSATRRPTWPTCPSGPRWPPCRATCRRWP